MWELERSKNYKLVVTQLTELGDYVTDPEGCLKVLETFDLRTVGACGSGESIGEPGTQRYASVRNLFLEKLQNYFKTLGTCVRFGSASKEALTTRDLEGIMAKEVSKAINQGNFSKKMHSSEGASRGGRSNRYRDS